MAQQTSKTKLSLTLKVLEFLRLPGNQEKIFTAQDIAKWIFATYPRECKEKQARSRATVIRLDTDEAVIQTLAAEIGANRIKIERNHTDIKTMEERPRKYYSTKRNDSEEAKVPEQAPEQAMYDPLASFLLSELNIYSKRIDEKRSSNKKRGKDGNLWLYPDMVGMEVLSNGWTHEIKECAKATSSQQSKLWSFEGKTSITGSNVRQVFFQTVSNSSWANFGYLFAKDITAGDVFNELRILSELHGIGVIRLDIDNPAESQILIPAQEHSNVDWNTANRIAEENKDFGNYIEQVTIFSQTGKVQTKYWANKGGLPT